MQARGEMAFNRIPGFNVQHALVASTLSLGFFATAAANPEKEEFSDGFSVVGEWGAGISGEDPELPTRIGGKEGGFCIYKPAIGGPAPVSVSIYRVSEAGSSGKQSYEVHHSGKVAQVEVPFAGVSGWVTLGTFPFDGGGREYLKLGKGRTAEVKFTIRSADGKKAIRSIVIPTVQPTRPPPPPANGAPRSSQAVTLPPLPEPQPPLPATSLQLPPHISDNMVIQRGRDIVITGRAPEQSAVSVELNGKTASARAAAGAFKAVLPAMREGGPYEMTVRCGNETRVIKNVLLGDVWIVAGQSNMAFAAAGLDDSKTVLADADYPSVRYYKQNGGAEPTPGSPARWVPCTPRQAVGFTAVGFLFARGIHKPLKVPVGLVYAWRDGGDIRLFMRDDALAALTPNIPFKPGTKPRSTLFSNFLAPLVGYPISGLVYYQGEGNQKDALFYRDLLPAMVKDVRALWGQGDFPFINIQLPRYKDGFVGVREAQFLAQRAITNSALVVSIDCGNPNLLHPGDKRLIGERAAKAALGLAYTLPGEYTGPMFDKAEVRGNSIIARFTHCGAGLEARGDLDGFILCGASGEFAPAKAEIAGPDTVRIWCDGEATPVEARYLWSGAPRACLYNREGFPASPFRSDPLAVNRVFDSHAPSLATRGEWKRGLKGLVAADTRETDGECDWHPWAKWTLEVQRAGTYAMYIRWPEGLAPTAAVRVEVDAGGYGYSPITVLQSSGGGQWHNVGKYRLDYGNSDTIKLIATGIGAAADAVKIVIESDEGEKQPR